MLNNIMNIINYYDPEYLIDCGAPDTEYINECKLIERYINEVNLNFTADALRDEILNIFKRSFNASAYDEDMFMDMSKDIIATIK